MNKNFTFSSSFLLFSFSYLTIKSIFKANNINIDFLSVIECDLLANDAKNIIVDEISKEIDDTNVLYNGLVPFFRLGLGIVNSK